jgi:predicted HTH domain antitoxin
LHSNLSSVGKKGNIMKVLELVNETDQLNLEGLVNAGIYKSEDEVIHYALKQLLDNNPEYRLKLAIYRSQNEEISIGKAAEIAGLCWEDMRDELAKNGVKPRLAPETIEEAKQDYKNAMRIYDELNSI